LELHHNNFGLENVGTVNISGNLQGNRHHQMISQHSGGSMNISSSGYVYARRIDGRVINSLDGTYINNEGRIRLAYQINGGGLNIYGEFDNAPGADIWIQDAEQSAITVSGQDAHFTNTGKIRLTGSTFGSFGIYVGQEGFFYNSPWGEIEMLGTELDDSAILIAVNGELTNNGDIHVDVSGMSTAISAHSGDLFNFGQIDVTTDGVWGIRISNSNARWINDGGYLRVYGNDLSIMANGDVFNQNCGIIEAKNSLRLQGGSQLNNDGYWEQIAGTVSISSPSQIVNDAVIYDPNSAFNAILSNSSFQNNGIVINRQAYTPQSGQSYYQVFEVGGTGWGYVDQYWTISQNGGPSFSEYNLDDNRIKFGSLPYQIDNLYAEVGINGCDFRTYRIPFAGAANRPRSHEDVPPAEVLIEQIVDQKDLSPSSTTVFPNPIRSDFQLRFSSTLESPAQIQLFDMNGRQLAQWTATDQTGQIQLNRPANTPSGMYLLNILHANGEVERQQLVFE
ncbi:MAG: T9SS type A sorting domain-containing protein, partial [Bacteroidota bacterium]